MGEDFAPIYPGALGGGRRAGPAWPAGGYGGGCEVHVAATARSSLSSPGKFVAE
jgi:hypothetical protein